MKYSEKWGDSIDIAVNLALQELGLEKDQVTVTVLEEPSKGFFGIGSKLAKVRVEEKEAEKPVLAVSCEKAEAIEISGEDVSVISSSEAKQSGFKERRPRREKKVRRERKKPVTENPAELNYGICSGLNERPADLVEADEHPAKTFLCDVAREMGLDISVKLFYNKDNVFIDVDGPDSGTVIGKRGTTLDALQYLTSLVVNKDENSYIRVVINAESYREKREKTLEKLANRLADKAVKTGRRVRLEPMNPYERKVIHTTLQSRPEVTTRSEGEEPYRKVIIEPSR